MVDVMTPRERFLAALHGQPSDRAPLAHVAALCPVKLQECTGALLPAAHHNPEQLVRLCGANHELLGFDAVCFIINYFNEPAALGVRLNWGTSVDLPSFTNHPWGEPGDATDLEGFLERPPVRTNLEALHLAKRTYGKHVAVLGKVMGPFSMLQVMHGVENTLLGLMDAPLKIKQFLERCVDVVVASANAQFAVGIDALAIGEGGAGAQMLSPAQYEAFLRPVHQRMIAQLHGPAILHMCGDISPRLPALSKLGLCCFNFDWAIAPTAMKAAAQGMFSLMGNVNTTDLLQANPEVIEQQVCACLEAGIEIISPGCAVSPKCPVANFRAMARAIEHWTG